MADFGLDATGLSAKSYEEIRAQIEDAIRSTIGPYVNLDEETPTGQLVGIVSDQLASLWQLAGVTYASQYPNSASGASLTQLAALTGTIREGASATRVVATVNLDPGTYAAGALVAHLNGDTTLRFANVDAVTNATGTAQNYDLVFDATATGPTVVLAGQIDTIADPVVGWNSVANTEDGTPGQNEESDPDLRARRLSELESSGNGTAASIAAQITSSLPEVNTAFVVENATDATDVEGRPAHSFEAVVDGPNPPLAADDEALAAVILEAKPAGVQAYGTTEVVVTDAQGQEVTIGFSRPVEVDVYIDLSIQYTDGVYVGDTEFIAQLVEALDAQATAGRDFYAADVIAAGMAIQGVRSVFGVTIDDSASPASFVVTILPREYADFDTGRIVIDSSTAVTQP